MRARAAKMALVLCIAGMRARAAKMAHIVQDLWQILKADLAGNTSPLP
jgi:hypothetical protein